MLLSGIIIVLAAALGRGFLSYLYDNGQTYEFKRYSKLRDRIETKDEPFPTSKVESITDEDLLSIIYTIESSFNSKDLNNFHRNIKNLKIKKLDNLDDYILSSPKDIYYGGGYIAFNNNMLIKKGEPSTSHEMLHVSSSNNKRRFRYYFTGFHQINRIRPNIGEGINEGYTEYLNKLLFECRHGAAESNCIYLIEPMVAEAIEDVIGSKKMQSLYLNADLKGLYNELSHYLREEESDQLIIGLDNINRYINVIDEDSSKEDKDMMINSCTKVVLLVNKILIKKLEKDNYNEKDIYRYFTNMNNIREGLTYINESFYKDLIDFVDEQEDFVYEYLSERKLNVSKEKVKSLKEYHIVEK